MHPGELHGQRRVPEMMRPEHPDKRYLARKLRKLPSPSFTSSISGICSTTEKLEVLRTMRRGSLGIPDRAHFLLLSHLFQGHCSFIQPFDSRGGHALLSHRVRERNVCQKKQTHLVGTSLMPCDLTYCLAQHGNMIQAQGGNADDHWLRNDFYTVVCASDVDFGNGGISPRRRSMDARDRLEERIKLSL